MLNENANMNNKVCNINEDCPLNEQDDRGIALQEGVIEMDSKGQLREV